MDVLKNISFSIALFIIGAIFVLLGLSGGITIGSNSLAMQESWAKILSIIIGAILVTAAIYLEVKPRQPTKSGISVTTKGGQRARADSVIYTLDDESAESFPSMIDGANRVQILGRTAVNILSQYEEKFIELGKNGCEIQVLFLDPLCETAKFIYGENPNLYKSNIVSACQHLNLIKSTVGHRLQVRVTKHTPTISIVAIEKQDIQKSFVQVQFYFLSGVRGRDRLVFRVDYDDRWYQAFRNEFTQSWSESPEWNVSHYLEQVNTR
jgi:hypothetical protein